MLYKTRGIVFRFTKYSESSIVVSIFTELFGLQTYIVNGVRGKTKNSQMAFYQPLTLLDLVVYHKENANLLRIKEVKCLHQYTSLSTDVRKSAQALFLCEIMNKTIKEESHTPAICSFLVDSFEILDRLPDGFENFHLIFLIKLSRFLGFGLQDTRELFLPDHEDLLRQLIDADYDDPVPMNHGVRRSVLELIIQFYSKHSGDLGKIKSVNVLREIFD
jgi:DNA repair protein RecO (recombination protein O)